MSAGFESQTCVLEAGDELELGRPVDGERGEVARVDSHDVRVESDGALELPLVVSLDQRVEAE